MRRRRTAAPATEVVDTAPAETTEDIVTPDSTLESTVPTTTEEAAIAEPVAPRPRRGRRPKAAVTEDAAPVVPTVEAVSAEAEASTDAPVEAPTAPEKPRRTRRSRKTEEAAPEATETSEAADIIATPLLEEVPVEEPATEVAEETPVVEETTDELATDEEPTAETLLAEEPTEEFAEVSEEYTLALTDPVLAGLLNESEAVLEEVLAEPGTGRSDRNRRNRRNRGRGRDRSGNAADGATTEDANPTGPVRRRGPQNLALTVPIPALPITPENESVTEPEAEAAGIVPVLRKRGTRRVLATRRVLTLDGVTVLSAEQAAALLGSVLATPSETGELVPVAPVLTALLPSVPEYTPLSAEILERLPAVAIGQVNGLTELRIDGVAVPPAFLFVNTEVADEPETALEIAASQIRRAYAAGVRLFTLLTHLPWKRKSGERRFDSLDAVFALVAANAADAYVLPRLIFSPPASWERANEDQMAAYAGGETGDVSIGSDPFWDGEAKDALRAAIEHLAESENAGRVLGVYLEHGEWFHPKGVGADRSAANTATFRMWLKAQYEDNVVALRSAWYDGAVDFDTAEIPTAEMFAALENGNGNASIFLTDRENRIADFHAYTSDVTASRIVRLAQIAKKASANRIAVAASYGYTLEIARPGSGHYALEDVLASPDVDILTAPISYGGRMPGGSAPFAVPVDSVHLAGKLFVSEDDTKTHLALRPTDDPYNPKITSEEGTRAVHARNFGEALAKGCGISWMDLWGEGWLDDDATWEHLATLLKLQAAVTDLRKNGGSDVEPPEVAVFVDERSFFDVRGGEEPALLAQLIARHRDSFARAGASVGYYLLSDLLKPEFPTKPRLFVFLNAFRLPVSIRSAIINRWQNDGRTFAWIFTPGVRDSGNIAELSETLGIQLRLQPWGSRTGTVVTDGKFVLTENAKGERFGEEKRTNPSLFVVDPKAQMLGEYKESGNPSLAYRKHPRWQTVFSGERDLPLPFLRGLYKLAGISVITPDDDAVYAATDSFVCIHAAQSGGITLYAPKRTESAVYDALTGEALAGTGYGARTELEARSTRLLVFAPASQITESFGLSETVWEDAPIALTAEELPEISKTFQFENAGGVSAPPGPQPTRLYPVELSVSAEDIAQFEAALAGEIALMDKDEGTGESSSKKRRRRRRRGAREEGAEETTGAESEESETGDTDTEGETDPDAADAVFALADLTDSAVTFDPDAILPLIADAGEGTLHTEAEEGLVPGGDSIDPVADLMARLFAMQPLTDEPVPAATPTDGGEPPRRPTLDELLPYTELPADTELPPVPDELLPLEDAPVGNEGDAENGEAISVESLEEEAEGDDTATETPQGLLASSLRGRRRAPGAGGFAARMRRRKESRGATDEDAPVEPSDEPASDDEPADN